MSPYTRKAWRARCESLANRLIAHRRVNAEDAKAWAPGGAQNADRSLGAWLVYWTWLVRQENATPGMGAPDTTTGPELTEAEQLHVLQQRPRRLSLITPLVGPEGPIEHVDVHSKGLEALFEADELDHDVRTLATYAEWLRNSTRAEDADLRTRTNRQLLRTQLLLVWIATAGRDGYAAACPYDPEALEVEPPGYLWALNPLDLARITSTFVQQNGILLVAISRLLRRTFGNTTHEHNAPSWATFVAQRELELGAPAQHLARRWPLAAMALSAGLRARSAHEAQEEAKKTATTPGG